MYHVNSTRIRKIKALIIISVIIVHTHTTMAADELYEGFCNPPSKAKPFVRWWWNGNRVEEQELLRELDLLENAGIGGVEINPIALPEGAVNIKAEGIEWLNPQWNRMVKVVVDGAKKRDMEVDLIVGSGWPFGGRFIKPKERNQAIHVVKKTFIGPAQEKLNIKELMVPPRGRHKLKEASESKLIFLRLVPQNSPEFVSGIELIDKVREDGTLKFNVPEGKHLLYAGTWQQGISSVYLGAPGADGPVLDHYNQKVVEKFLNRMSDKLGPVLGGKLGNGLRSVFCDSIELSKANWTTDIREQFYTKRGYSVEPYLPFVLIDKGPEGNSLTADLIRRARYDFNKTLVEIFSERFIIPFHNWCHANGTLSRYQAYGAPWFLGMLDGYLIPDIPEGDMWLYNSQWFGDELDNIRYAVLNKYASSGAHLTGRQIVSCEAVTNLNGVFRATLEYIKQSGDINFITGVNHNVLCGFNYSPPEAGFPGWLRFGTFFSEHNTWWPYFKLWADYSARLSWIFQESKPQVKVAILGPTADVWSQNGLERNAFINTPWYLHQLWQPVHQNGYSADYVNATVLQGATFEGGKLRFGPMAYDVLLVANVRTLEPETARAIEQYARAGGKIVFIGSVPDRSAGLIDYKKNDKLVKDAIAKSLLTNGNNVKIVPEPQKEDLLRWTGKLLAELDVKPDVKIIPADERLFQIHSAIGERDIYFFTNQHRDKSISFKAQFFTGDKTPWQWNAETAERSVFPYKNRKDELDIALGPLESLLLVFEPDMEGTFNNQPIIDSGDHLELKTSWQVMFEPVQGQCFTREMDHLIDFSQEPSLRTFAGRATYRTNFRIDKEYAFLDLGQVYDIAEVKLNGKDLGVRWWGQKQYNIENIMNVGENTLEVKITTVLFNYCNNLKENPTAWLWTHWNNIERPAVRAGLIGPVHLYGKK